MNMYMYMPRQNNNQLNNLLNSRTNYQNNNYNQNNNFNNNRNLSSFNNNNNMFQSNFNINNNFNGLNMNNFNKNNNIFNPSTNIHQNNNYSNNICNYVNPQAFNNFNNNNNFNNFNYFNNNYRNNGNNINNNLNNINAKNYIFNRNNQQPIKIQNYNMNNNMQQNQNNNNYNNYYNNQNNNFNNINNNNINNYNNQNNNNFNNQYNNQNNNINNQNNFNNNFQNNINNYNQNNSNNTNIQNNNSNQGNNNNKFNQNSTNNSNLEVQLDFMIVPRGLENVGATCYMNATLQCLYHVKPLSENLINDEKITKSMEITYSYKKLIEELTGCTNRKKFKINRAQMNSNDGSKNYVIPNDFKNVISEKNELFKGIKANDSKDLILFLLENMNDELTRRNNGNKEKKYFVGNNRESMKEENFKEVNNSIFAELFYGFQRSLMMCKSCGFCNETFNVINLLIFPLEKIYNSLNKKNNINMNNNMYNNNYNCNYMNKNQFKMYSNQYNNFRNEIGNYNKFNSPTTIVKKKKLNLEDCFKEYEKEELLSGIDQIYCNKCKCKADAITKSEIYKAPEVLIIILNRGKDNIFDCDVKFPLKLDISGYIHTQEYSPRIYDLIGVISHFGKSSMEGHFIAFCKYFDGCSWHIYNDAIVRNISEKEINRGTPYILFYQNQNLYSKGY